MRGHIKWFNHAKGFGFVTPLDGSQDAFVHKGELSIADLSAIKDGDEVEFEIMPGQMGPAAVDVRLVSGSGGSIKTQPESAGIGERDILSSLRPHEQEILDITSMSEAQKKALRDWGFRMFTLGQHKDGYISDVKYDGRLIILDDDSRWEVDPSDTMTAESWVPTDRVVVIDGHMFRLDETETVQVEEEL